MRYTRLFTIALVVMGLGWASGDAAPYRPDWRSHERHRHDDIRPGRDCPPPQLSIQDRAGFFGSEDYYQAHGGTPRDFVIGLYGDVLGRAPTSAEIDRWVSRLGSCGDGVTMSREFLIYAQSELIARAPVVPPCPPDGRPCYHP